MKEKVRYLRVGRGEKTEEFEINASGDLLAPCVCGCGAIGPLAPASFFGYHAPKLAPPTCPFCDAEQQEAFPLHTNKVVVLPFMCDRHLKDIRDLVRRNIARKIVAREGGKVSSEKKKLSSRRNGRLGGRPKKT